MINPFVNGLRLMTYIALLTLIAVIEEDYVARDDHVTLVAVRQTIDYALHESRFRCVVYCVVGLVRANKQQTRRTIQRQP